MGKVLGVGRNRMLQRTRVKRSLPSSLGVRSFLLLALERERYLVDLETMILELCEKDSLMYAIVDNV